MLSKGNIVQHVGNDVIYELYDGEELEEMGWEPLSSYNEYVVGVLLDVDWDDVYKYYLRCYNPEYQEHWKVGMLKEEISFVG